MRKQLAGELFSRYTLSFGAGREGPLLFVG
jgi:hypothetical protein